MVVFDCEDRGYAVTQVRWISMKKNLSPQLPSFDKLLKICLFNNCNSVLLRLFCDCLCISNDKGFPLSSGWKHRL